MNILYEQFPEEVKVNGEYYPIVTDFREWIRFTELVEDDSVPWRMKCGLLLQWYLDQIPDDIEAAIYALGDFLMCKRMYQDDLEDEEEEQQKVAAMCNDTIPDLSGREAEEKALQETIRRVKQNSIAWQTEHLDPGDMDALQKLIRRRRDIEKLHISLD